MDLDSLSSTCCSEWVIGDADIKPELHEIIHKLVMHIHESEPDIEKSILVFLPTYYSLEQQWVRLRHLSLLFKIHILHRSIDTNQALLAMKVCKSHRKVIYNSYIVVSNFFCYLIWWSVNSLSWQNNLYFIYYKLIRMSENHEWCKALSTNLALYILGLLGTGS